MLRRAFRLLSTLMIVGGVLLLAWAFVIWKWNDPITGFYTRWEQRQLASSFEETLRKVADEPQSKPIPGKTGSGGTARPATVSKKLLPARAQRFWKSVGEGDPVARLKISRLGLNVIVVKGTDSDSLKKGPGVDGRTALPGEGRLVYIAGHRTTYLAPFSHIDKLQPGDTVQLDTPYAH